MEGKDNRSVDKRKNMKQTKRKNHSVANNTASSSTPPLRGIADVADSSDDRFEQRVGRWTQQRNYDLDELDMIDSLADDAQQMQMRAGDFATMSQNPTSIGGHFKFASEKNWDEADVEGNEMLKNTEAGEYFTLNLKLLNAGLKTIPFHKRMEYPSSMFTTDEIARMEKEAQEAEYSYQNELQGNPIINIISGSVRSGSANTKQAEVNDIAEATEKVNINENTPSPTPTPATAPENTTSTSNVNNEIQDWLDNVLEEGN